MTETPDTAAARLLHLRGQSLAKGDPISPPITMASMFHLPGTPDGSPFYGRATQPTWQATEHLLSHLENAPSLLFPSGMGAISAALFATLKAGDRLLVPSDGYYNTRRLGERFLARLGVEVVERPTRSFGAGGFEGFAVVFIETPSNPGLDLINLAETCAAIRAAGGLSVVDNTTMTPLGQRPLDLGADIVVASDTKAPGGHSDILMGHVSSRDATLMESVNSWRTVAGGIPGPMEAWLLHRSLETLHLRFAAMCATAEEIAPKLAAHPAVQSLRYPGLPGDPSHNLAKTQMVTNGFLIGLTLKDEETAEKLINTCPFLRPATSFGGIHSSAERRARWGDDTTGGFIRLSVGTEPADPLWQALDAALNAL